ncbi:hypothetical protein [Streptomyces lavendulocolor]|uniref:hypothetical protein n=1 Tax=Streptomyces lavendulocolor TaxID=67316 RepID=UPI003C2C6016
MSIEERREISSRVLALRELMHGIVNDEGPLVPEPLREGFRSALDELDRRGAFDQVIKALRPEEESDDEPVARLEGALQRVGLLGRQLELKLAVIDWSAERAYGAWQRAREVGLPEVADPEDDASFDASNPPEVPDRERRALWRRARKLLAKLLKIIDDFFSSLISAIPNVGELILELKEALESVLDR